jgi:S1-C subfamily serine protease
MAEVVRKLAPSVVRLQTGAVGPANVTRGLPADGFGTGVIVDAAGHIVTCGHVLIPPGRDAAPDRVVATIFDGRSFLAGVVGLDRRLDLAVLKIDAPGLVPAVFGDPAALEPGESVVAIGFALDLQGAPTVSAGIVSALRRKILEPSFLIPDAIQTDAAIHPGNSGGPLANRRGEVIGLNTAVVSGTPGIGFAMSASIVQPVVRTLKAQGKVEHAYLGVATSDTALQLAPGQAPARGVPVLTVMEDSPARKAGLRAGDVLVTIENQEVTAGSDLLGILAMHRPGDRLSIELRRGAERLIVVVELGRQPDEH